MAEQGGGRGRQLPPQHLWWGGPCPPEITGNRTSAQAATVCQKDIALSMLVKYFKLDRLPLSLRYYITHAYNANDSMVSYNFQLASPN